MKLFINKATAISPINSWGTENTLLNVPDASTGYFVCKEPDYKTIIDKKLLRRMSKFIKMSVANAIECLAGAGLEQPDAILTGTALGCVADTVDFLKQLNENNETLLNPTAFMQSTHNTASGQIALLLGCKNFNVTFSQKNTSFESALLQAEMMLPGNGYQNILVGGMDEITPESFQLLSQTDCFGKNVEKPYLPGEGAAFFVLSDQKSEKCLGKLEGLAFYPENISPAEIEDFLKKNNLTFNQIGLFLTGAHPHNEATMGISKFFSRENIVWFKEFCGEYDTSSAFALWLALQFLNQKIEGYERKTAEKILIHNQGSGLLHSLMLVSSC